MQHPSLRHLPCLLALLVAIAAASAAAADRSGMSRPEAYRRGDALAALGRKLFLDPALSGSRWLACASCHSPARAFGPTNALPVQPGGRDLRSLGTRAVPSLRYLQATPQFTEHFHGSDSETDDSIDNGPTGGLTWDGRADRVRDQARIPLLSPQEMANESPAEIVAALRRAGYSSEFRRLFGETAAKNPETMFAAALQALEVYQQSYAEFYPYSSRYDAYLAGKAQLTAREARGLALFNDPAKGNCAQCHISAPGRDGTPPQFTDYGLIALGVPRNGAIPANADPAYFDLGLCGPSRRDFLDRPEYCGRFKTPSLRNVATRRSFFHNGVAHSLTQAIAFYVERDIRPEKWYPRDPDGTVLKFDDLPAAYRGNVNTEPPFGGQPGDKPVLSEEEIGDIAAFLATLTDADVAEN